MKNDFKKIKIDNKVILNGVCAYPGLINGKCKLVFNAKTGINNGDVLVARMTEPNFVPLIKKASAIVTDSGGILSHAAIIAREWKKPCIVGAKFATNLLKDGDILEVNASDGVVKVL